MYYVYKLELSKGECFLVCIKFCRPNVSQCLNTSEHQRQRQQQQPKQQRRFKMDFVTNTFASLLLSV